MKSKVTKQAEIIRQKEMFDIQDTDNFPVTMKLDNCNKYTVINSYLKEENEKI